MDGKVTYLTNRKTLAAKEHGYCVMVKMIQKWWRRENDEEQAKRLGDGGVFAPITVVPPSDAFLVWGREEQSVVMAGFSSCRGGVWVTILNVAISVNHNRTGEGSPCFFDPEEDQELPRLVLNSAGSEVQGSKPSSMSSASPQDW
jgi:hypothetical protein